MDIMNDKLQNLRKAMDSTTHNGKHFTERQKNNIREAINSEKNFNYTRPKKYVIFGLTAVVVTILAFLISTELIITPDNYGTSNGLNPAVVNEWKVRNEYVENNKVLFSVFPDPALTAGKPYGYIFSFTEPFETFKGKELAIYAQHLESGERITALAPKKITEPSPGYPSLERFTHTFEVPVGGLWKYEVFVDDQFYGDVILSVSEKMVDSKISLPESIPNYVQESDFSLIDWGRKAVLFDRNIIGNENKSGVIGADMPSLNNQKWMWHLWGVENPMKTKLTVVGFHKETETVHQILTTGWAIGLGEENNGADAHVPSSVKIPRSGEWAILLYTDEKLFDILVYEINK
jgi:hypothetical protein